MDPARIAVRAIFAYLTLLLLARISGKRVVSQATPFDFTISLIVGDLFDDLFWGEVPASQFVAGVGALFFVDAVAKFFACRSPRFFELLNGPAHVILADGVTNSDALREEQLSEEDLEHLLRKQGFDRGRWKEIRLAVLERDHTVGVLRHDDAEPMQRRDAGRVPASR